MSPELIERRAPAWIRFQRAEDWGIRWTSQPRPESLGDPETFVHHSAGSRLAVNATEAMRRLQDISYGSGYSTIGYDVVVHRDVTSETITISGAREGWRSAATRDRNERGEAICLLGYFHPGHSRSERPTTREIQGIAWGIAWMIAHGWSAPDTVILGHRDNPAHPGATACPGDYLYEQLPRIRNLVREILSPPDPNPPGEDEPMRVAYVKHHRHPAIYSQWSNGTTTWIPDPATLDVHAFVEGIPTAELLARVVTLPNDQWRRAAGPIVGPIPPGVDGWGCPRS